MRDSPCSLPSSCGRSCADQIGRTLSRSRTSLGVVALALLASLLWPAALARGAPAQPPVGDPAFADSIIPVAETAAGPVVARISVSSQADINRLAATLDVWSTDLAHGQVVALLTPGQARALQAAGHDVVIEAQRTAELARWRTVAAAGASSQPSGIPSFPCYRTTQEIDADLASLAVDHPHLAQWLTIGESWQAANQRGGADLHALVLTNRASTAPKAKLAVLAAIHARELATAELAARFAEGLVAAYGSDAEVTWLLDHTEVHILPMANPDGRRIVEESLVWWRKNTNDSDGCSNTWSYGVDLNRNSSFKWNQCEGPACSSGYACDDTYRGRGPASEPEVQAVESYLRSIFPDQRGAGDEDAAPADATGLFITLHSYGELVLYPWGWRSTPAPNGLELDRLGRKFAYFNRYTVCQAGAVGCLYQTDGSTDDWAYGELGVAAYTFELGTDFFESCATFENAILQPNMDALMYAAKAARQPYTIPAAPDAVNVAATPALVLPGEPVTVTATLDSTRIFSTAIDAAATGAPARLTVVDSASMTSTAVYTLTAADGAFDGPVEQVTGLLDTRGWAPGRYLLVVEGQGDSGAWGAPGVAFLDIFSADGHRVYLPLVARDKDPQ